MPNGLTPEQIELLRSMPRRYSIHALILDMDEFDASDLAVLTSSGLAEIVESDDSKHFGVQRERVADILLATIERQRDELAWTLDNLPTWHSSGDATTCIDQSDIQVLIAELSAPRAGDE